MQSSILQKNGSMTERGTVGTSRISKNANKNTQKQTDDRNYRSKNDTDIEDGVIPPVIKDEIEIFSNESLLT